MTHKRHHRRPRTNTHRGTGGVDAHLPVVGLDWIGLENLSCPRNVETTVPGKQKSTPASLFGTIVVEYRTNRRIVDTSNMGCSISAA
jgi:hypothetical protein